LRGRLRLIIAGDGPLREPVLQILERANARELAWLPGSRRDVKAIMQALDFFVLPSLAEGISNTILEAMASGLPVVATHVGGNSELVHHATTGTLVPSGDVDAMARAMLEYVHNPELARSHGRAGRARAEQEFGLDVMVSRYAAVYDRLIDAYRARKAVVASTAAEAHGGGH
jgi:glycosyltransferase involved in cell wall biosynthesis